MNNVVERKCRCGNDAFTAHQITRHDVIVNSDGAYQEDKGIYDAEDPYGPFTCTVCGAKYEELDELEGYAMKKGVTICLNGGLSVGDTVISAQGDEYEYLIGSVLEINLLGTPDHDTENITDDVHVDFSIMEYSGRRRKEIAKAFSAAYGYRKAFRDCPIDDVIMDPGELIRITGMDDAALQRLLAAGESAKLFCDGFQAAMPTHCDCDEGYDGIFSAIEPGLASSGYKILEGDRDTVYLRHVESGADYAVKVTEIQD